MISLILDESTEVVETILNEREEETSQELKDSEGGTSVPVWTEEDDSGISLDETHSQEDNKIEDISIKNYVLNLEAFMQNGLIHILNADTFSDDESINT